MEKNIFLTLGIPVLIAIIAVSIFLIKPFSQEREQLKDLRVITESEQNAKSVSSQFGSLLKKEQALVGVLPTSSQPLAKSTKIVYDIFDTESINLAALEAHMLGFVQQVRRHKMLSDIKQDILYTTSRL